MSSPNDTANRASPRDHDRLPGAVADRGQAPSYRVTVETAYNPAEALELWGAAGNGTVFNHPAWWSAAISAFGQKRPLCVVRVTAGTRLAGLWPLWRKRLGTREGLCRVIEPVGARVTDYCEPLIHRDHDAIRIATLFLEAIAGLLDFQTIALLPKLPQSAGLPVAIEAGAKSMGLLIEARDRKCPAMTLPSTFLELERRWSKSHRGDIRRQVRRLEEAGELRFVSAGTRAEVLAMLPRLFAMHKVNWNARTGYSELATGPIPEFMTALARDLPLDCLDASELQLDGVAIALHFGFRTNRSLLWYKPAFDITWANYAPGKVHVAMAARSGIEAGLAELDFMQGEEQYKQLWADGTKLTRSFALARRLAFPIWAWNARVRRFTLEYRL